MEFETTGVEVQEVAEPVESEETQEVAEPVEPQQTKTAADSAFAEMRRAREEAERREAEVRKELAEIKAANSAREEAIRRIGGENADINALASSMGLDPEDVLATLQAEEESAKKDLEIQRLQEKVNQVEAEKQMQNALLEVQAIDPSVKSLYELGDSFAEYIGAGLSVESAYYAVKAKEIDTKVVAPKEIGKVNNEPPEKDYFTEAEVDAMTPEQQSQNYEKIRRSFKFW